MNPPTNNVMRPTQTHTPGPWLYAPTGKATAPELRVVGADLAEVACTQHCFRDQAVNIANARLIAAAPELLAALKTALAAMADLADAAGDSEEWNEGGYAHEACNQARAAIARAAAQP